ALAGHRVELELRREAPHARRGHGQEVEEERAVVARRQRDHVAAVVVGQAAVDELEVRRLPRHAGPVVDELEVDDLGGVVDDGHSARLQCRRRAVGLAPRAPGPRHRSRRREQRRPAPGRRAPTTTGVGAALTTIAARAVRTVTCSPAAAPSSPATRAATAVTASRGSVGATNATSGTLSTTPDHDSNVPAPARQAARRVSASRLITSGATSRGGAGARAATRVGGIGSGGAEVTIAGAGGGVIVGAAGADLSDSATGSRGGAATGAGGGGARRGGATGAGGGGGVRRGGAAATAGGRSAAAPPGRALAAGTSRGTGSGWNGAGKASSPAIWLGVQP